MYIKRSIEEVGKRDFELTKALAFTGARQVGKSTMVNQIFPNIKKINMKDAFLRQSAKEDPANFLKQLGTPLFIDEIQEVPELLSQIKVVLDEKKDTGYYIFSGSQKWELMKNLGDSLSGMVSIKEMSNLSLREIQSIKFNEHFKPTDEYFNKRKKYIKDIKDVWFYIFNGMYPELYNQKHRDRETFYRDYVQTYLERDVYKIIKINDSTAFYRFMVSVAARTGSVLNCLNIANDVGIDSKTVSSWISILEKTGIIFLLQPYYNSHLNRGIKSPKIYFRDTGLASYLTGWNTKEQLELGAMNGAFFETFIVNEIIKSFINEGKEYSKYLFYYRNASARKRNDNNEPDFGEIDLIYEENFTLYPIEIKKSSNVNAKMADAFQVLDKDSNKKRGLGAIIYSGKELITLRENVVAIPINYI